MKNKYRLLSMLCMLIFIGSVVFTVIYLFGFQDAVASTLSLNSVDNVSKLKPLISQLGIYTFVQVISGLTAILFLTLATRQVEKAEVVYIEKRVEKTKQEEAAELQLQEDERLAAAMAEADEKLARIKTIADASSNQTQLAEKVLQALCSEMEAVQGALFLTREGAEKPVLQMVSSYAYFSSENKIRSYELGEGLIGQVAKEARQLNITAVPEGYITVLSGLGNTTPGNLLIYPIVLEEQVSGIIEVASFHAIGQPEEKLVKGVSDLLGGLIANKTISAAAFIQ